MSRAAAITGAVLLALGLAVFAAKVVVYRLPLAPTGARGLWQVALRITVRGDGERGSVNALLPTSGEGQLIFDERSSSDRLDFSIRPRGGTRTGVWTGRIEDIHEILYEFRVQSFGVAIPLPQRSTAAPPGDVQRQYGRPTPAFPSSAPEVTALLGELDLPGQADPVARVRTIFAFVSHEVATVQTAGEDALLTLTQREGSPEGKARLLVTLLRAAGVPARNVRGLELREGTAPQERVWTEAWVNDRWVPMSGVDGFFAQRPADLIVLGDGDRRVVEATAARAVGHNYRSLREHLRPEETAALMTPANRYLAAISLYQLPLPAQSALRLLLLFPIGALVVALFRNVVGVPTYGTFMPVLIAFALRGTTLAWGLALVGFVLALGVVTRLALERLRLLLVPRLAILLCLVVLSVTGLALLGRGVDSRDLFAGILFPIVILTMLVERFSITMAEEGLRTAVVRAAHSLVVAVAVYPAFRSLLAEHLMFSFPELVVCIMGLLVWIGGYTGYRVLDLLRFRLFTTAVLEPGAP
jgi:hypothetical protein